MDRVRQLLTACEHGDGSSVQALLDEGIGVDCADDDETTPLQVAAANGHDHIVRLLLMRGAALDKPNLFGWTPLMHASRHGHVNVVATILQQRQADINAGNRMGASALTVAARGGHLQVVRLLVESGIDLNGSGNSCEYTPLLAAAQHGHDAVLRFLLDRGLEVNMRTPSSGLTPLMLAALNGHMTTSQILIERGCDPNLINVDNKTALEIATIRRKREVWGYLDRKTTNKPEIAPEDVKPDIIDAAKNGDIHRLRDILDHDHSQKDACSPLDGATPLMFAAMTGRLDIAQLLVDRGCDINKQDTISGWTALMQATYHGKKDVAMYLLKCDADVNIQAKNGCTAFDMASLIDDVDTDLLRLLAAKAMAVNKVDKGKKHWPKQNGMTTSIQSDPGLEDQPKSGLKAWWSRLSNRFRKLKLGRTSLTVPNRLAPITMETAHSTQDLTLNSPRSPIMPNKRMNNYVDPVQTSSSITSYETMWLETQKSASMYTLDINPTLSTLKSETLKPVIPPFLPPPSFALDGPNHPRKPMSARNPSIDTSMPSPMRPMNKPMMFLSSNKSSSNLSSSPVSPSSSARFTSGGSNPSPGSSGEYNGNNLFLVNPNTAIPNKPSSTTSPFLPPQTPSRLFMPRKSSSVPAAFRTASNTTSPNSSTSGSSSITPQRSHGRSTSSKGSTTSTLTPSPSPTPGKYADDPSRVLSSLHEDDDELSGILKKLSLEKYQPMFEEQEVDMEAFLMLTDSDLKDLGISNGESRCQILTAITELNTGKGKERQQFLDTMTSFQSTLKARVPSDAGSSGRSLVEALNIRQVHDPTVPGSKSRSS